MSGEMTSRERVAAALRREVPDRVPYCEEYVSRPFAERLLGWPRSGERGGRPRGQRVHGRRVQGARWRPRPRQHHLRAPGAGLRGEARRARTGSSTTAAASSARTTDLAMVRLPDPHDDALYAEGEPFAAQKGDFSAWFNTRIGIFSDHAEHGARGLQPRPVRRPSARRAAARHVRRLDRGRRRTSLPAGLRRLRLDRRHRLQHGALLLAAGLPRSRPPPLPAGGPEDHAAVGHPQRRRHHLAPGRSRLRRDRGNPPDEPAAMDIRGGEAAPTATGCASWATSTSTSSRWERPTRWSAKCAD